MSRPDRCEDCGAKNPYLTNEGNVDPESYEITDRWVCNHRRACEARQMLQRGEDRNAAIRHAQRLDDKVY